MFSGDTLLLTRDGYRHLSDIREPVEVISEYTDDGTQRLSYQEAVVTPMFESRGTKIITVSGRPITVDRGSGYFLTDIKTIKREKWTHKALAHQGSWVLWQAIADKRIIMSQRAVDATLNITKDDWAFYAYGFNDEDDPDKVFPLPSPARLKSEVTYKNVQDRRQDWPNWYWHCTLSEKAMFLRGIYDAHGRMTKTRVYYTCPNDQYSQQMIIALSEFGIRASRFVSQQEMWVGRPREYVVDVRNATSLQNMVKTFYWSEPALPSYKVSEVQRHANKFFYANTYPTGTTIRTTSPVREMMYRLDVNETHNAILNGLILRDSLGAFT